MSIKKIQIKFWYECVRNKLEAQNKSKKVITAYLLEGMQLAENSNNKIIKDNFSNRWYRYQHGLNMPRACFVHQIDQKISGSAAIINHPIWLILKKIEAKSSKDIFEELQKIDLKLFNKKTQQTILETPTILKVYTNGIGRILAQRDSLDSVAALILYVFQVKQQISITEKIILNLRFNSKERQEKKRLKSQLSKIIYYIHRTMLLLGMKYLDHSAFELLVDVYKFIFHYILQNIPISEDTFFSYNNITNFTNSLLFIKNIDILVFKYSDQSSLSRYSLILNNSLYFNIPSTYLFLTEKKPFS